MSLQQALDLAVQHHQAGRLREADTIYRKILAADPNNAHALHLTGLLASQVGQTDVAVDYIRRAITLNPTAAHFHSNLGAAHATAGRSQQALEAFERALLLQPDLADAHENKGMTLLRLKRFQEAIDSLQKALRRAPAISGSWITSAARSPRPVGRKRRSRFFSGRWRFDPTTRPRTTTWATRCCVSIASTRRWRRSARHWRFARIIRR